MGNRQRFVLIKNERDLERVLAMRPDLLRTTTALAATPHAALLLRECGVAGAVMLGDVLSAADRIACLREAQRVSQTWHELLVGATFDDVRRAQQLLRDDLLMFFLQATAAQRSVDALCERVRGAEFWIFPGASRPLMWQSDYDCSHGLIEAAVRDAVARGYARVEYVRPLSSWHPARIGRRLMKAASGVGVAGPEQSAVGPAIAGQPGSEIGWADAAKTCGSRPLALAVGHNTFLDVMFGYAPGLEAAGYMVLGASTTGEPVATSKRISSGAARPYFRMSAMPHRSGPMQDLDFVESRRRFEHARLAREASAFRNPFLSFQYDHIFSVLVPQVLRAYIDITRVLDDLEPSLVLVASHGFHSRAAALAARERGVRSVFVPHGGALVLAYSANADAVWAWGTLQAALFRDAYGLSGALVTPVGAPQLAQVRRHTNNVAHRAEVRQQFAVPVDGRMLLVLTSGFTDGPWQPVETQAFIEAWDGLFEWTSRNPDVTLVLRPHPLMDMSAWYRTVVARRRLKNLRIAENGSVDEIVCGADAAVVMECTTTAALVAHAAGCPVLHVRSARWNAEGDAVWTEDAGLTVARQATEIAPMLDGILRDSVARDTCVRGGQRFFDAYVADDDGVDERVRAAAAEALPATTAGQPR